jgi:hypothetical protein
MGSSGRTSHYIIPATAATVHWGYFSRSLKSVLSVEAGDFVTIETLTHHAYDDHARMIAGDPGAEDVFLWTNEAKNVDPPRRGTDGCIPPWARRRRGVWRPHLHRPSLCA